MIYLKNCWVGVKKQLLTHLSFTSQTWTSVFYTSDRLCGWNENMPLHSQWKNDICIEYQNKKLPFEQKFASPVLSSFTTDHRVCNKIWRCQISWSLNFLPFRSTWVHPGCYVVPLFLGRPTFALFRVIKTCQVRRNITFIIWTNNWPYSRFVFKLHDILSFIITVHFTNCSTQIGSDKVLERTECKRKATN